MTTENRLFALMMKGWTIRIEYKGGGRDFEFTCEGVATNYDTAQTIDDLLPVHAVACNTDELLTKIEEEIKIKENNLKSKPGGQVL